MGQYTDNLMRRRARRDNKPPANVERLTGVAILRLGHCHSMSKGSHAELRRSLGDERPYDSDPYDVEGFITSRSRFVTRDEAKLVGEDAGQCQPMVRTLLSSDIDW